MAKIVIQIGFERKAKEGQLVEAYINDEKLNWNDRDCGVFLTPYSDSDRRVWFLWSGDLDDGDTIKIGVKTGLRGKGQDEDRTMDLLYKVDSDQRLNQIKIPKVGFRNYPILKGSIIEVGSVSESDRRMRKAQELLEEGFE